MHDAWLQAEKGLRQNAERAQTEILEAAGGREARIQALQLELGQATAKAHNVSAMGTQLTAARSRMEQALEDLQVSWILHSAVYSECSCQPPK